jgi:hypothetical protein
LIIIIVVSLATSREKLHSPKTLTKWRACLRCPNG